METVFAVDFGVGSREECVGAFSCEEAIGTWFCGVAVYRGGVGGEAVLEVAEERGHLAEWWHAGIIEEVDGRPFGGMLGGMTGP